MKDSWIRNRSPIALEGIPFVVIAGVVSTLFYLVGLVIPALIFLIITLFILWFFRDPGREVPSGEGLIISPADGKVIDIHEVEEGRILKKKTVRISIFMNLFNVHINRVPCSGRISDIIYNPGRFVSANKEKASLENEQNAIVLERPSGERILFVQIAGLIARRIVCWLKKGDYVHAGQRFGLIRFGSRVDIYLPRDIDIRVSIGQKVKGGESILALIK